MSTFKWEKNGRRRARQLILDGQATRLWLRKRGSTDPAVEITGGQLATTGEVTIGKPDQTSCVTAGSSTSPAGGITS